MLLLLLLKKTNTMRSQSERTAAPKNRPDLMRSRNNDGINIQEQFANVNNNESINTKLVRPEMKGPTDISDLLSGLKTMSNNPQPDTQTKNIHQSEENIQTTIIPTKKIIWFFRKNA